MDAPDAPTSLQEPHRDLVVIPSTLWRGPVTEERARKIADARRPGHVALLGVDLEPEELEELIGFFGRADIEIWEVNDRLHSRRVLRFIAACGFGRIREVQGGELELEMTSGLHAPLKPELGQDIIWGPLRGQLTFAGFRQEVRKLRPSRAPGHSP